MKLLIQPDDGAMPIVKGIAGARNSVELTLFRFDQREIEQALARAVSRGVSVHALIAHTNRAGTDNLRDLEMRLLAAGATVTRTADDLVRYHGKLMIVDRKEVYLTAFNFTHQDIERSRSFGIVTRSRSVVREAGRLFEADSKRNPYEAGLATFVVSPINARKQLSALIQGAKRQLLIYDPEVTDVAMLRLLRERAKEGVEIRILGKVVPQNGTPAVRKLAQLRLHTRTIVRDARLAFVGSQSLRTMELDMRREIGVIFRDPKAVSRLVNVFEEDWLLAGKALEVTGDEPFLPAEKVAKKVAKAVVRELPSVTPVIDNMVKELVGETASSELNAEKVEESVKEAVKAAIQEAVKEVVEQNTGRSG